MPDVNVETDEVVQDNAQSGLADANNPSSDPVGGNSGGDSSAGSLTNPNTGSQAKTSDASPAKVGSSDQAPPPNGQQDKPAATVDWERQYKHLQSLKDRQLGESKRQFETMQKEMQELRQFREQQQRQADQAKLKPWSKQHPEHAKFGSLMERAKTVREQLSRIPKNFTPEQREAAESTILSTMSEDDQRQLMEYRQEQENFQREFFVDPRGTLMPMVGEIAQQVYQQVRMQEEAQRGVAQELGSQELKPLVEEHAQELKQALSDGVPYDYAVHMLKMYGDNQRMRNEMGKLGKDASMGREQVRLAQGKAAVRRDAAPVSDVDVYSMAKKEAASRGIATDSPRFLDILMRLERSTKA